MFSDASWISDPDALLQQVLDIQENAQYCEAFKRPEACWGDDVVRPILNLAHKAAGLGKDVRVDNVYAISPLSISSTNSCRTSTRIWPASLVQRSAAGNPIPIDTKKVDYGFFLAPSPERKARAQAQLNSLPNPTQNLNQTGRPEHATSAILLSIEIKTSVSVDYPLLQLAIWASAGLQAVSNVFRWEYSTGYGATCLYDEHERR
jgi:hypothetical protein